MNNSNKNWMTKYYIRKRSSNYIFIDNNSENSDINVTIRGHQQI